MVNWLAVDDTTVEILSACLALAMQTVSCIPSTWFLTDIVARIHVHSRLLNDSSMWLA